MERAIITISENGTVNILSAEIWMSEMELVELFGVIAPNNSERPSKQYIKVGHYRLQQCKDVI